MKTKSTLTLVTCLLVTAGFALAQTPEIGRCGQPRGTCGNDCNGQGYMHKGGGRGNGSGARQGPRDGSGKGNGSGQQKRDRKRDGTGSGSGTGSGNGSGCQRQGT